MTTNATPFSADTCIRPAITRMQAYTPIVPFDVLSEQYGLPPEQIIKLDANENPYGPSPQAAMALARYPFPHIYPDPEARDLRRALSRYTGLPADYLQVGNGADELISLIVSLFIAPGDVMLNCPPTFGMYAVEADIRAAKLVNVPRRPDFSLDMAGIVAAVEQYRPKLLFITTPNNPDGSAPTQADLERLLALPVVLVVDEAYAEFCGRSFIDWVARYPNLIVLRTFSKWAGLAGLRVGYGAFPPNVMTQLWKVKPPYNVNAPAQAAALASLRDADYLLRNVAKIRATRDRFLRDVAQIPWLKPCPSHANFVLCRVLDRPARRVKDHLAAQGIFVRHYAAADLHNYLRIGIGTPPQMERVLQGLQSHEI